ncbi:MULTISPECIES: bifunctional 2-polyprenyl-6-hydroxyphenol methylase/3-demethylubiquinol 3-O-methyltransferase UbiG [unclassified Phenylobacterium]|uniref:class I SAM-dependent methyltransferase n=1 Tax=unclassified Phenylobacterium TaxID=2640670 RepID=UPI0022B3336B|nr:class I SAM-dependent methyltransferase [Phenylobacterium sp. NIBR 498073]MBS0491049.1 class I SAM-dependent methyltransferase [Pseudomonadota bacterium]WGU39930.1 class I SAM-dependent methyltransferase [Phenylobacterium sp. NIBR 498073]
MAQMHDADTLAFYDREAAAYAARQRGAPVRLQAFLEQLRPRARILELGCGAGQDAELMTAAGFEVTPTDGSAGLAAEAEARLGRPVRVMRFEELDETAAYDGVWANACLLHVPEDGLADVLARIHRALKPGGRFHTGFKAGDGGGRDSLGRYYNFPDEARLRAAYGAAGDWAALTITPGKGGGFDGVMRDWLFVDAVKG